MFGKNFFVLLLSLFLFSENAKSQEDKVKKDTTLVFSGDASLNFSNVGLSNWSGGGDSSISIGGVFNGKISKKYKKSLLEQVFSVNFGMARLGNKENLFKKTDDQFILETSFTHKIKKHWNFSSNINIRSQMIPGYSYATNEDGNEFEDQLISNFLAPGYISKGVGIQYKDAIFSISYSLFTGKTTLVLNEDLSNKGAFGVRPGTHERFEFGMNMNAQIETNLSEDIKFKSVLNLFSNYQTVDKVDVNWENILELKVNKYINTNFGTSLIYDHDVLIAQNDGGLSRKVQFKNILNLTFGTKFTF